MIDEDSARIFIEGDKNVYWTIVPGAYHTQAYDGSFSTWFGTIYPGISATSELATGDYLFFVHEQKRAYEMQEVNYPSIMYGNPQVYTLEDKDHSKLNQKYWKGVYQEGLTQITLDLIVDSLTTTNYRTKTKNEKNNKENDKAYFQQEPQINNYDITTKPEETRNNINDTKNKNTTNNNYYYESQKNNESSLKRNFLSNL